ncbi:MAG: hypothetical protein AB2813_03920 [Candidatus Sedimenticola endophacoides]
MRNIAYGLILAALVLPFGQAVAEDDRMVECKKAAAEEEVPAAEMEMFLKECMEDAAESAPSSDKEE